MQYDVHNGDSDDDDYGNFDNSEDYISEYFTKIEVIPLANEYDDVDANETPSTVQYNARICQGFSQVPVFYSNDVEPIDVIEKNQKIKHPLKTLVFFATFRMLNLETRMLVSVDGIARAAGHGQRRNHMSRLGEKTRAAAEEEGASRGQEQVCRGWGRSFCHGYGRKLESQKRKHRVVIQAAQHLAPSVGPSPKRHTTMSLDETTLVENQSYTTLSPGGTTVIQGKGKGLFNDSNENVRNPEITPEFLAQNRKQVLLLLQKEEKEQQLKEARARLEFEDVSVEDVGEDDAEVEAKLDKETSQPKIQEGRKENHEDGLKSQIAKKLEFEDDYSKPYRPSTAQTSTISMEPVKGTGGEEMGEISLPTEGWCPSARLRRSSKVSHRIRGFAGEVVHPVGQIQLPVVIGNETGQREVTMTFLVIRAQSKHDLTEWIVQCHDKNYNIGLGGLDGDTTIQTAAKEPQLSSPSRNSEYTSKATFESYRQEPRLREKEKQVSRLEEKAHAAAEEEKAGAAGHGQRRNHMSRLREKTRAAAEEEGASRDQEQVCRGWGRSFCHGYGRKLESQKRKHRVVIQAAVGEKANSLS
ncbi:hypothetical protein E3N88_16474 [Mikania micrantha]|uniref:Uncharacterized protein n=1 Tax=Mikania micrantha TaxID=192012 RepID=A0A5N6NYI0_9ASTR|nr:hypothetical protein E3N88_16474 [Mikania micrantha]